MNKDIFLLFYAMISSIWQKLIPVAIIVISFVACSKDNPDSASILMKKVWSPYQIEILMVDTNRVVVTDKNTGKQTETDSISRSDTIYLPSTCQRNSVYQFKANGIQTITDACSGSMDYNTNWTITQTNQMFFTQFVSGLTSITGLVSEVNTSKFVFNLAQSNYITGGHFDASGNQVSTADISITTTFLTFKSR